jgi:hypothetical protein
MDRATKRYQPSVLIVGLILLSSIVGLTLAEEVVAATISVPRDYSSIQKAFDSARKGDKVRVSQGTYYENITMKEGVTLEGGWNKDFSRRDIAERRAVLQYAVQTTPLWTDLPL